MANKFIGSGRYLVKFGNRGDWYTIIDVYYYLATVPIFRLQFTYIWDCDFPSLNDRAHSNSIVDITLDELNNFKATVIERYEKIGYSSPGHGIESWRLSEYLNTTALPHLFDMILHFWHNQLKTVVSMVLHCCFVDDLTRLILTYLYIPNIAFEPTEFFNSSDSDTLVGALRDLAFNQVSYSLLPSRCQSILLLPEPTRFLFKQILL